MKAYRRTLVYTFADGTQLMEDNPPLIQNNPSDEVYRVGLEDRLVDIAYEKYGNHEEWVNIARVNNLIDPWENITGTNIIIPAI